MQIYFRAGRLSSKLIPGQPWRALQLTKKKENTETKVSINIYLRLKKKYIWTFSFFLFFFPLKKKKKVNLFLLSCFLIEKKKIAHEEQQTGAFQ